MSQTIRTETLTFIDSHAHLDDGRFDADLATVIDAAAAVGVTRIINIGYRPARWASSIALANAYPGVSFTLGLHPHHAEEFSATLLADLRTTIEGHRPVALGEIGLDYFRDLSDRGMQQEALAAQLALASDVGLPVVMHLRGEVESDLIRALDQTPDSLTCVFHSFDGSAELAQYGLDRGFVFGVGGLATKAANSRLREILTMIPLDRLMLETDAPYLVPATIKDRRNTPANIPFIAAELAVLKGVSLNDIAAATTANTSRVFNLPDQPNHAQKHIR